MGIKQIQTYPYLPCPICRGVEGCDHTVPERRQEATRQMIRAYAKPSTADERTAP